MNIVSIGIDPGKSGFIAINYGLNWEYFPIPLINDTHVDLVSLNEVFKSIKGLMENNRVHAVLEDVHAIYGSSAKGTFSFGWVNGIIEMALVAHSIPFTKVQPKKWQAEMWQGIPVMYKPSSTGKTKVKDTKGMSLLAVKRLFPQIDLRKTERSRKPDENKVDAILIAEYCKRRINI